MPSRSYSGRRAASGRKVASTIRGASSFRLLLRRIPPELKSRLVDFLTVQGAKLADIMGGRIPVSGKHNPPLRLATTYKVLPATLSLKVGLLTKNDQRRYFYGHILDIGRRAKTVTAWRRKNGKRVSSYTMNIRAMPPRHLLAKSLQDFRDLVLPDFRKLLRGVLVAVSTGVGDD